MTVKTFCDVCGTEVPDTATMEHNEATQSYSGRFIRHTIVVSSDYDLCAFCSLHVEAYIEKLRKGEVDGFRK